MSDTMSEQLSELMSGITSELTAGIVTANSLANYRYYHWYYHTGPFFTKTHNVQCKYAQVSLSHSPATAPATADHV